MDTFSFSTSDLKKAACAVRESMLLSLSGSSSLSHDFTNDFQKKIQTLFLKNRHRLTIHKFSRRIAIIFLSILLTASIWLAATPSARAAVLDWLREIYQDRIVYWFHRTSPSSALPDYVPTWIPDGFQEVDIYEDETMRNIFYQSADNDLVFEYQVLSEDSASHVEFLYDEQIVLEQIDINGIPTEYLPAGGSSNTHSLIWFNQEQTIVFMIHSNLGKEVLVQFAKNIILIDK